MSEPKYGNKVRLTLAGGISNKAILSIGDQGIPFYKLSIDLSVGEYARLSAEIPIDSIDVEVLQAQTAITLVDPTVGTDVV